MSTRAAAVAGTFYPNQASVIHQMIDTYLADTPVECLDKKLHGFVSPHAGFIYSGPVAAACYKQLQTLDQEKEWTIFLLGPAHRFPVHGISVAAFDAYTTPLGSVKVSPIAIELAEKLSFTPQAHAFEHCLEVQLPFLQKTLRSFQIVPILLGRVDPRQVMSVLEPYMNDATFFIASSDLSHFYPYQQAVEVDSLCNEAIPKLDVELMMEKGEACGKHAVVTLMEMARKHQWEGVFLDYKNSGDTSGPKDNVVGYGAYAFVS